MYSYGKHLSTKQLSQLSLHAKIYIIDNYGDSSNPMHVSQITNKEFPVCIGAINEELIGMTIFIDGYVNEFAGKRQIDFVHILTDYDTMIMQLNLSSCSVTIKSSPLNTVFLTTTIDFTFKKCDVFQARFKKECQTNCMNLVALAGVSLFYDEIEEHEK